jgi:hypothetical protein
MGIRIERRRMVVGKGKGREEGGKMWLSEEKKEQ